MLTAFPLLFSPLARLNGILTPGSELAVAVPCSLLLKAGELQPEAGVGGSQIPG